MKQIQTIAGVGDELPRFRSGDDDDMDADLEDDALMEKIDELEAASGIDANGSPAGDEAEQNRLQKDPEVGAPAVKDVGNLLMSLKVQAFPDGSIRVDAPREAAGTLASLFEGLARMLRESAP
jgi:hypothetical protein